jgi:hypothetical protein
MKITARSILDALTIEPYSYLMILLRDTSTTSCLQSSSKMIFWRPTMIQWRALSKPQASHSTIWRFIRHHSVLAITNWPWSSLTHIPIPEHCCCWKGAPWILHLNTTCCQELRKSWARKNTLSQGSFLLSGSFTFCFCQILHEIMVTLEIWDSLNECSTYKTRLVKSSTVCIT